MQTETLLRLLCCLSREQSSGYLSVTTNKQQPDARGEATRVLLQGQSLQHPQQMQRLSPQEEMELRITRHYRVESF